MSGSETSALFFIWQAVKHVQSRSPVTLTDSEVLRLMGIPLDAAEAVAQIRQMKREHSQALVEVKSLQAEVERLRAELEAKG